MSENETTYGTPKTVCDEEPFPPQTGDLLGSYIARLSARVRELEAASTEPSAYQRSLEARIERLEGHVIEHLAGFDEECAKCLVKQAYDNPKQTEFNQDKCFGCYRITGVKQPEPTAEQYTETRNDQSRVTELEPHAVTTLEEDLNYEPLYPACENCGHAWADHDEDHKGEWCKLCSCIGYKNPIPTDNTPTVTRERTHGQYGTRNLTKTKSIPSGEHRGDFFASCPGDVCARCGHVSASHNATWDTDTDSTKSWCNKKGCTCAGFLFAEPEPTAEPVCATCGHAEAYHLNDTDGKPMCRAGTLGKPCMCKR